MFFRKRFIEELMFNYLGVCRLVSKSEIQNGDCGLFFQGMQVQIESMAYGLLTEKEWKRMWQIKESLSDKGGVPSDGETRK